MESAVKRVQQKVYGTSAAGKSGVSGSAIKRVQDKVYGGASFTMQEENSYAARLERQKREDAKKTPVQADRGLGGRVQDVFKGIGHRQAEGYAGALEALTEGLGKVGSMLQDRKESKQAAQDRELLAQYRQDLSNATAAGDARAIKDAQLRMKAAERRLELNGSMGDYYDKVTSDTVQGLSNFGDRHDQKAQAAFQKAKSGKGAVGGLLVDAGAGLGDVLGDAAANAVLPGLGTAARVVRSFGHGAEAAEDKGLGIGRQALYGAGSAALGEGVNRLFSGNPILEKATGKGALDDILFPNLGKTLPGRMLKSGIGEGIEEGTENLLDPVVQLLTMGAKNTDPVNLKETGHDALVGALIGSLTGISGPKTDRNAPSQAAGAPQDGGRGVDTTAAQEGVQETGNAVRAGRVTTIKSPYQGVKPVQAQKSTAAVPVDSGSVERAQNRINGAHGLEGAMPGKGFKATLKEAYKSVFKPTKGVPVDGVTFEGKPYTVDINKNVPGKVISDQNLTAEKLALLDILPQVVQNGEYVGSGEYVQHGSREKPVVRYDYFETPVEIGGKPYIAKFDVEAYPTVNNYRTHQIAKIDLTQTEGRLAGPAPVPSSAVSGPVEGTRPLNSDSTIAQGADSVNMTDDGLGAANAWFDPFTAAENEYGTLPSGENPVRSDDVPVSTDGADRVSQTVVTAKGAAATPEQFVPLLENATMKGQFSFIPITNSETVQRVIGKVIRDGWPAARANWTADVRAGKAGDELSAMGALLYNNAVNSGDTQTALDILTDYQRMGRNTARGLQAMRILKTLTPESRLYMIRRSVESMVDSLGIGDIQIDQALEQEYLSAASDAEADAALDEIKQNVADQIPSTFLDKWTALRYVNMLGNFKTQVRNIVGNVGMGGLVKIKDSVAAGLERLAGTERTKSFVVSRDLLDAAKQDFTLVRDQASGSGKYTMENDSGDALLRDIMDRRQIFKTGALEAYRKATDWAMNNDKFGDVSFLRRRYGRALAGYLKANGITEAQFSDPTWKAQNAAMLDKARAYAIQEAQEATFRDDNTLSKWVSTIGRRSNTPKAVKIASEGLMPFRKTPANVLLRAEEYSPLGLLNTAVEGIKRSRGQNGKTRFADSEITGADIANSLAKSLTGTGVFLAGMMLRNAGFLLGGDDDDQQQAEFDDLTGHQGYSLELPGGTSVTLDWLTPAAMPLFMGVQMMDEITDGGFELKDLEKSLTSIAEPMLQMSMLQGVNDVFDDLKYSEDNLGQLAVSLGLNYLTQGLTNSLLGQIERSVEGKRMTTYTDRNSAVPPWLQYELGRASAKTPRWDYQQIPYIDAWGREEETGDPMERAVNNLFNPAYVSQVDVDKVERELQRVKDATGDGGVFPQRAGRSITVDGEKKNLTAEEYQQYAKALGNTSYQLVKEGTSSAAYRSMSDSEKAAYIDRLYAYADQTAKASISAYKTETWVQNAKSAKQDIGVTPAEYMALYEKYGSSVMSGEGYEKTKQAVAAGLSVDEYAAMRKGLDADGNGGVIQKEAQAYLDGHGFTTGQKADLWTIINKSWKKNPYQ